MDKGQHRRLFQAGGHPDHLAEEVSLAECVDVGLEGFIPVARPSSETRLNALFLKDILNGGLRIVTDPEFFEFAEDPVIAPPGILRVSASQRVLRLQSTVASGEGGTTLRRRWRGDHRQSEVRRGSLERVRASSQLSWRVWSRFVPRSGKESPTAADIVQTR